MLSPKSVIDDCKPACTYKFTACKLHNSLFISVAKRKLRELCRTAVQCVMKFCLVPCELSFVLTNFLQIKKTSKKNHALFKRISARYTVKFHSPFRRKVAGTKNEIRAFRLCYFCTILQSSIAFGNAVPNFSPNDGKRVFMMIEPRMINVVVTRRC